MIKKKLISSHLYPTDRNACIYSIYNLLFYILCVSFLPLLVFISKFCRHDICRSIKINTFCFFFNLQQEKNKITLFLIFHANKINIISLYINSFVQYLRYKISKYWNKLRKIYKSLGTFQAFLFKIFNHSLMHLLHLFAWYVKNIFSFFIVCTINNVN
jgi:hypothetical protein